MLALWVALSLVVLVAVILVVDMKDTADQLGKKNLSAVVGFALSMVSAVSLLVGILLGINGLLAGATSAITAIVGATICLTSMRPGNPIIGRSLAKAGVWGSVVVLFFILSAYAVLAYILVGGEWH